MWKSYNVINNNNRLSRLSKGLELEPAKIIIAVSKKFTGIYQ